MVHLVRYVGHEDVVIETPISGRLRIADAGHLLCITGTSDYDPLDQAPLEREVLYVPKWAVIDIRRVKPEYAVPA